MTDTSIFSLKIYDILSLLVISLNFYGHTFSFLLPNHHILEDLPLEFGLSHNVEISYDRKFNLMNGFRC